MKHMNDTTVNKRQKYILDLLEERGISSRAEITKLLSVKTT